jgi:hypothetical protein
VLIGVDGARGEVHGPKLRLAEPVAGAPDALLSRGFDDELDVPAETTEAWRSMKAP